MTLLSYFVKDAQFASNRKSNPDSRFDMVHGDPEDLSTCPGLCSSPTVRAGSSETVLLGGGQVKGTEHSKPAWRRLYSNPQLANLKEQEISPPQQLPALLVLTWIARTLLEGRRTSLSTLWG